MEHGLESSFRIAIVNKYSRIPWNQRVAEVKGNRRKIEEEEKEKDRKWNGEKDMSQYMMTSYMKTRHVWSKTDTISC